MNKKIIAAAVAATLAAPIVASADNSQVTIYGKVHVTVDYTDQVSAFGENELNVASRASRIGFKGQEDLGNGIKAIWKAETTYDFASGRAFSNEGDKYINARNTYIGLSGGFGTFVVGRHDTPYKLATGKLDMFVDTIADFNSTVEFEDKRTSNTIAYISPKLMGVGFSGAVIANGVDDEGEEDIDGYSLAVTYSMKGGPLFASLAYEDIEDLGGTIEKIKLGLGIKMAGLKVNLIVSTVDSDSTYAQPNQDPKDGDRAQLQAGYSFGGSTVKGMFGKTDNDLGDIETWAVGYDYNMSKRTRLYALYTDKNVADVASWDGLSLGMIHKF